MLLRLRPVPFAQWLPLYHVFLYSVSVVANFFMAVLIMMTVEQIRIRLADANLKRVAENAGVHPATVYRFMREDSKPLYETVKALSDYLTRQGAALND